MEIAEGIHRLDTELGDRCNSVYLFVGEQSTLLFDVGIDVVPTRDVEPYLQRIRLPADALRYAVISHCDVDHFGGLRSLQERFPTTVVAAHREDAPLIERFEVYEAQRARGFRSDWSFDEAAEVVAWTREVTREGPLDVYLSGGERFRLSDDWVVEILHAPGHSRGHLSVWDERSRSLVVSDAVLSDAVLLADGQPAFPPTYRFVDDYLATINGFVEFSAERLLTAHYPTMGRPEASDFLARSRSFVEDLDATMLAAVEAAGGRGITLGGLVDELNPAVGDWPMEGTRTALAFPVVGHLERALSARVVERLLDDGPPRVRMLR